MEGLYRRRSGVYVARMVVPERHRAALGRREFLATTGSRDHAVARIVAGSLLTAWRRQILALDSGMDPLQLTVGSPALTSGTHLRLAEAASLAGLSSDDLLRAAADGVLGLYYRCAGDDGFDLADDDFELSRASDGRVEIIVPTSDQMPDFSATRCFEVLRLTEPVPAAQAMLTGQVFRVLRFAQKAPGRYFVPCQPVELTPEKVEVFTHEVDALRARLAARVTPQQLDQARLAANATASQVRPSPRSTRRISESIDDFISDRSSKCAEDQARRIRGACMLFVELMADPQIGSIDRDLLRRFRDVVLPSVPANENKIRLKYGTTSMTESMKAVSGTPWPRISNDEVIKRMQWVAQLFAWLKQEGWADTDLAEGLTKSGTARKNKRNTTKKSARQKRDAFNDEEIHAIFSQPWYSTGRGELTAQGTYREFCPLYYWLPLLGLNTGGRINELSQLSLNDIKRTEAGVWYIDINEEDDRKLKNAQSIRQVAVHPVLLNAGFAEWHCALRKRGFRRLFPELKRDAIKGHGKAATKWFSSLLKRLGWVRNGRKVFHSFRHTLENKLRRLNLSPYVHSQITGHERGSSVRDKVYGDDLPPDELAPIIAQIEFDLPPIAPFDIAEGLRALDDALRRKNGGRGSTGTD